MGDSLPICYVFDDFSSLCLDNSLTTYRKVFTLIYHLCIIFRISDILPIK